MTARIRQADEFVRALDLPEAYRVGGSVRDEQLGRNPKDADYVVRRVSLDDLRSAVARSGAQVSKLQTRDGKQVGVRAAQRGLGLVEIVLPRTERSTGPGHGDFEIITDPELGLDEDAQRRDFTINALYRDVMGSDRVLDPTDHGFKDIDRRLIRTTHADSFRDDPLRTLRALRFVAKLSKFDLERGTRDQIEQHADAVTGLTDKGVSGTAFDELCKLLMGRHVSKALRIARETGVLGVFLPELQPMLDFEQESKYHSYTVDEHTFHALDWAAAAHLDLRVRMSLLFHDAGKPASSWRGEDGRLHYYANPELGKLAHEDEGAVLAASALKRLNSPGDLRRDVVTLIERHMVPLVAVKPAKVRRWRVELGDELLADLLKHRIADVMGKGPVVNYGALDAIAKMEEARQAAAAAKVPTNVKELPITGHDLMELGLKGPAIGRVQRKLLLEVVGQPSNLKKADWLRSRAAKLATKETR